MKRGEVWTVSGGPDYAGKPRPIVIVQDDSFAETDSITLCAVTTEMRDAPQFRLAIEPDAGNGLRAPCFLMADKITTAPKTKIGRRIGRLSNADMLRLNRAMLVFLGLAGQAADSR